MYSSFAGEANSLFSTMTVLPDILQVKKLIKNTYTYVYVLPPTSGKPRNTVFGN